jgi:methionyl-tRNA synthetase
MNYYATTSIPYMNGDPHIGFGMELVQADVLARVARLKNKPVIFSTGSDEHGEKIVEKATEQKLTPQEYVDVMSQKFRDLCKLLNVSNDRFIRTTDKGHEQLFGKLSKMTFTKVLILGGTVLEMRHILPNL